MCLEGLLFCPPSPVGGQCDPRLAHKPLVVRDSVKGICDFGSISHELCSVVLITFFFLTECQFLSC